MKTSELIEKLEGNGVVVANECREISTGYCGDFLSFVMGKAPVDCAWFTVMTNINVAAVATLAEISAIVICEGCVPDESLISRAQIQHINIITTKLDIFNAVLRAFDAS
ncbi:MAG: hypothetical protein PHE93_03410 [Clostridia bacterium]|nr:hypothetical protein [Clostridia bacterium]